MCNCPRKTIVLSDNSTFESIECQNINNTELKECDYYTQFVETHKYERQMIKLWIGIFCISLITIILKLIS